MHEGGWRVCSGSDGQAVFFTPGGKALFEAHRPTKLGRDPVGNLVRRNRERGVTPDAHSAMPGRKRDSLIPWSIEAAAMEALDEPDERDEREEPGAADEPDAMEEPDEPEP